MTYINLTRHDARLGGDLRLRLAWHLQNVSTWWTTGLVYTIDRPRFTITKIG